MTWQPAPFRSRRCDACDINWPHSIAFDECPGCGNYTESSTDEGLSAGPAADLVLQFRREANAREAVSRQNHEEFERYLAERDEAIVSELVAALDLLPTTPSWLDDPPARTTQNFGLAGGELGC